jgi:hypothetical protein
MFNRIAVLLLVLVLVACSSSPTTQAMAAPVDAGTDAPRDAVPETTDTGPEMDAAQDLGDAPDAGDEPSTDIGTDAATLDAPLSCDATGCASGFVCVAGACQKDHADAAVDAPEAGDAGPGAQCYSMSDAVFVCDPSCPLLESTYSDASWQCGTGTSCPPTIALDIKKGDQTWIMPATGTIPTVGGCSTCGHTWFRELLFSVPSGCMIIETDGSRILIPQGAGLDCNNPTAIVWAKIPAGQKVEVMAQANAPAGQVHIVWLAQSCP